MYVKDLLPDEYNIIQAPLGLNCTQVRLYTVKSTLNRPEAFSQTGTPTKRPGLEISASKGPATKGPASKGAGYERFGDGRFGTQMVRKQNIRQGYLDRKHPKYFIFFSFFHISK
jgi:hypothetical protein